MLLSQEVLLLHSSQQGSAQSLRHQSRFLFHYHCTKRHGRGSPDQLAQHIGKKGRFPQPPSRFFCPCSANSFDSHSLQALQVPDHIMTSHHACHQQHQLRRGLQWSSCQGCHRCQTSRKTVSDCQSRNHCSCIPCACSQLSVLLELGVSGLTLGFNHPDTLAPSMQDRCSFGEPAGFPVKKQNGSDTAREALTVCTLHRGIAKLPSCIIATSQLRPAQRHLSETAYL